LVSSSLICLGEEAFDHRDFRAFRVGEFGAAAGLVHLDRFAALLDHLLEDFGDEQVVVRGRGAGAQLDVAILQRRKDEADGGRPRLVARLHGGDLGSLDLVANHEALSGMD
jgi:hypothetical protein